MTKGCFTKQHEANICLVFICKHRLPWLSRVLCVAALADYSRHRFFPRFELFFGRFLFLKMPHISLFSEILFSLTFEIPCHDSNVCACAAEAGG